MITFNIVPKSSTM